MKTITLNSNDISNDSNSYSYGDKSRAPLISGINTKVTLVSNGKRHSIIRDTSDYTKNYNSTGKSLV